MDLVINTTSIAPQKVYRFGTSYAEVKKLASQPFVGVRENIISPVESRYIIEKAREKLKPARVVLDTEYGFSEGRTGYNCWLAYKEDETIKAIGQRIASLVGMPLDNAEALQVVHYGVGQEYRHHFDAFNLHTERGVRAAKWGGQRLVTVLMYLNDVAVGGGTDFSKLGLTIDARRGRMVLFHNTTEDISKPHENSLHAGLPVEEGEKWMCNMWFRHTPMKEIYEPNVGVTNEWKR